MKEVRQDVPLPAAGEECPASALESLLHHPVNAGGQDSLLPHIMLGRIVSAGPGGLRVVVPALKPDEMSAVSVCAITENETGKTCAVQFIDGDGNKPLIMGLLYAGAEQTASAALPEPAVTVIRDGERERVKIDAQQELVLQCGASRIVLRADGVIHIRGLYIDSQARATQRIRAGSVQVN